MTRIILFGATGMIGCGVFLECLADPDVSHVLSIGRRATNVQHLKLKQIVHDDFTDYSGLGEPLAGGEAGAQHEGPASDAVAHQDAGPGAKVEVKEQRMIPK